jgi:hypothetical protein
MARSGREREREREKGREIKREWGHEAWLLRLPLFGERDGEVTKEESPLELEPSRCDLVLRLSRCELIGTAEKTLKPLEAAKPATIFIHRSIIYVLRFFSPTWIARLGSQVFNIYN